MCNVCVMRNLSFLATFVSRTIADGTLYGHSKEAGERLLLSPLVPGDVEVPSPEEVRSLPNFTSGPLRAMNVYARQPHRAVLKIVENRVDIVSPDTYDVRLSLTLLALSMGGLDAQMGNKLSRALGALFSKGNDEIDKMAKWLINDCKEIFAGSRYEKLDADQQQSFGGEAFEAVESFARLDSVIGLVWDFEEIGGELGDG